MKQYYTFKGVAGELGVHPNTVRLWLKTNKAQAVELEIDKTIHKLFTLKELDRLRAWREYEAARKAHRSATKRERSKRTNSENEA